MTETIKDREIKLCCATFYQSDLVRTLLGDVLHPGGLALTGQLGEAIRLGPGDHVLDVACGRGSSAVYLAQRFGCHVTGLDFGPENIAVAQEHAREEEVAHLTTFRQGDAERLPFEKGAFDAVISECSFCTFPDKATAAAEMARVLQSPEPAEGHSPEPAEGQSPEPAEGQSPKPAEARRGGRLGLTDVTVNGELPDDVQTLLAWVACVAGAGPSQSYVATLERAGFTGFTVADQRDALLQMVRGVRHKLLGVEILQKLGKLDLGDLNLNEGKRLTHRTVELIENGLVGYTLITAEKGNHDSSHDL